MPIVLKSTSEMTESGPVNFIGRVSDVSETTGKFGNQVQLEVQPLSYKNKDGSDPKPRKEWLPLKDSVNKESKTGIVTAALEACGFLGANSPNGMDIEKLKGHFVHVEIREYPASWNATVTCQTCQQTFSKLDQTTKHRKETMAKGEGPNGRGHKVSDPTFMVITKVYTPEEASAALAAKAANGGNIANGAASAGAAAAPAANTAGLEAKIFEVVDALVLGEGAAPRPKVIATVSAQGYPDRTRVAQTVLNLQSAGKLKLDASGNLTR